MRNPVVYYGAIVIGIIALAVGVYYLNMNHPTRAYAGLAVGVILVIAGIVGIFMTRSRGA